MIRQKHKNVQKMTKKPIKNRKTIKNGRIAVSFVFDYNIDKDKCNYSDRYFMAG